MRGVVDSGVLMRIMLLGPNKHRLERALDLERHFVISTESRVTLHDVSLHRPDLILSYGYRHLLPPDVIDAVHGQAINMHISLLPWNRGADPNFWSWVQNTPKGVTIHWMDSTFDTGQILAQSELVLDRKQTLAETYEALQNEVCRLLEDMWSAIEKGDAPADAQSLGGSYHNSRDKEPHAATAMPHGWDTQCLVLEEYGYNNGLWIRETNEISK